MSRAAEAVHHDISDENEDMTSDFEEIDKLTELAVAAADIKRYHDILICQVPVQHFIRFTFLTDKECTK